MNLEDQKKSGVGEIYVSDSLNAPLISMKITRTDGTIVPDNNKLIVYIDRASSLSPTTERKMYSFDLVSTLGLNEHFKMQIEFDSDVKLTNKISRIDGSVEQLETLPFILFEGENYIYTNYQNATIEFTYLQNNEFNKTYLSNALYSLHRLKNDGEFSLDDIYFKDCFTETENGIDLSVNRVSVNCISSLNNKFYLDSDGNLTVNTITTVNQNLDEGTSSLPSLGDILNYVYPVGSIYLSMTELNPGTLFGGTWEQLKDKFLLGTGDIYGANSTGGEAEHLLTVDEMPTHTHIQNQHRHYISSGGYTYSAGTVSKAYAIATTNSTYDYDTGTNQYTNYSTPTNQDTGGSLSHNNMPPYFTVYMWKRTA